MNKQMDAKKFKAILILIILEGLLPLVAYFREPSMERNAFLFGYSASRLLLGGLVILTLLVLTVFLILYHRSAKFSEKTNSLLDKWFTSADILLKTITTGTMMVLSIIATFLLFAIKTTIDLNNLVVVYERLQLVIIWLLLVVIQLLVLLIINYGQVIRQKGFFNFRSVLNTVVVFCMGGIAAFHCAVLYYEIQYLASIPYWTWFLHRKDASEIIYAFLVVTSIAGIFFVFWKKPKTWMKIIVLVLMGVLMQVGFGFVEGGGLESLRNKLMSAGHVKYLEYAVDNRTIQDAVMNYEEMYGWDTFLGTKPPGVLIYYLVHQDFSTGFQDVPFYNDRLKVLSDYIIYVFPIITFLAVPLLYWWVKKMLDEHAAFTACVLYIFLPNLVLMPFELDQSLFPHLFLIGLMLTWKTIKEQKFIWGLITGLVMYLITYMTFSLLPLIILSVVWIVGDYLFNYKEREFKNLFLIGLGMLAGFAALYAAAWLFTGYDLLSRYQVAIEHHKTLKEFEPGLIQILKAIRLNNLEIAAWIGFPVALLCVVRVITAVYNWITKKADQMDVFALSFMGMFVILNIIGQTRGEVGRLWIFMTPVFVLFSVEELRKIFKKPVVGSSYLFILQIVLIYFTFRFQDFW